MPNTYTRKIHTPTTNQRPQEIVHAHDAVYADAIAHSV